MDIVFSISAIILLIITIIIFKIKKKDLNDEQQRFNTLMLVNFFGLIFELARFYICKSEISVVVLAIINKLYLVYIMLFSLLFTVYIFTICYKNRNNLKEKYFKFLKFFAFTLFIIGAFAIALLPVIIQDKTISGSSINIMYIHSFLSICIWIISMFKNMNKIDIKKFIPVAIMIIFMGGLSYIQQSKIDFTVYACVHAIVLFITLFTLSPNNTELEDDSREPIKFNEKYIENRQAFHEKTSDGGILLNASDFMIDALQNIVDSSKNISNRENISDTIRLEIDKISLQSQALLNIASGISDITKMDMQNIEIVENKYNIKDIIKNVVMLSKAYIGSKNIDLKLSIDSDLPDHLYGDASKVEQIFLDLLTNAIKNTEKGHIELKIDTVLDNGICKLMVTVSDTGKGMKQEELDNIFDKKENYTNDDGLVLSTTKALVEKMNGQIFVESDYGIGSKFIVSIEQKI